MSCPICRGHDLIDRDARQDVLGLGALGADTGEPAGGAHRVIAARRGRAHEIRDHDERVAERLERLQRRREFEARSDAGGRPRFHDGAVGNEDGAESRARRGRRLRERGERTAPSRRAAASATVAPTPLRNVRRGNAVLVRNVISPLRFEEPAFILIRNGSLLTMPQHQRGEAVVVRSCGSDESQRTAGMSRYVSPRPSP